MAIHKKLHSFTGTTDHDFTGLISGQLIQYNGSGVVSAGTLPTSGDLFSASTGVNSIIANNGTGNLSSGDFGVTFGWQNFSSQKYSFIAGGFYNSAITSVNSVIVGGQNNYVTSDDSFIGAGSNNTIKGNFGSIIGGAFNVVGGAAAVDNDLIVAGYGRRSGVVGGEYNTTGVGNGDGSSFIGGGRLNRATNLFTAVIAGSGNTASGPDSVVVGGRGGTVSGTRSVLLGGLNLINTYTDTLMSENIYAHGDLSGGTNGGVIYSAGTDLYSIFLTTAPSSDVTRVQGGTNISTGGTANAPVINLDADIVLTSVNATSISGGTIYSGSTDLYDIFSSTSGDLWSASTGTEAIIANNGTGNLAAAQYAIVAGESNSATTAGINSVVMGGKSNITSAGYTVIAGGSYNVASNSAAFIGAGNSNIASGQGSVIGGGQSNTASANNATIAGGNNNLSSGGYAFIGAGKYNSATTLYSSVLGGYGNLASGAHSTVLGGYQNKIFNGTHNIIGAGQQNTINNSSYYSFIAAGYQNTISGGNSSSILGGGQNLVSNQYATIINGSYNSATTTNSLVGAGQNNLASGGGSTVLNGLSNTASGQYSSVLGGRTNTASSPGASVIGGSGNTAAAVYSVVVGGQNITASQTHSLYTQNARLAENSGVIYSAGTDLYNIFLTSAPVSDVTRVQGGTNISTGGTANFPIVNLDADIVITSVNATSLSGDSIYSGTTDLGDIFVSVSNGVTGSGTNNTFPIWNGTQTITNSIMTYDGVSGVTVAGDVFISGNVEVLGTATTITTQDLYVADNTITLNSGGTSTSATGGGIFIEDGVNNGNDASWIIDAVGNWTTSQGIISTAVTVNNGNLNVTGGGAIQSGGTDLYSIFVDEVSAGTNVNVTGTASIPIVNLDSNIVLTSVNATTLSGGTIYSGSTDLYNIFGAGGNETLAQTLGFGNATLGNNIIITPGDTIEGATSSGASISIDTENITLYGDKSQANKDQIYLGLGYAGLYQDATNNFIQIQDGVGIDLITPISINVGNHIYPKINNSYDLGTNAIKWRNMFSTAITGNTIHANEFFSMTPYTDSSPASPSNNDAWFHSGATGTITINYRVGGTNYSVELA